MSVHVFQVYLADYGLSYRYCPNGNHKQYQENPRKGHNGTIEFTSIDAHKGVGRFLFFLFQMSDYRMSNQAVRAAVHRSSRIGDCSAPRVVTSSCAWECFPREGQQEEPWEALHTQLWSSPGHLRRAQHQT